jgi:hypothetical protein
MTRSRVVTKRPTAEMAATFVGNACASGRQSHPTIHKSVRSSGRLCSQLFSVKVRKDFLCRSSRVGSRDGYWGSDTGISHHILTGNPDITDYRSGDHITATADLNCAGPCTAGSYVYSTGITSFSLGVDSSANVPLFTLSSPGASSTFWTNYMTFDNSGELPRGMLK